MKNFCWKIRFSFRRSVHSACWSPEVKKFSRTLAARQESVWGEFIRTKRPGNLSDNILCGAEPLKFWPVDAYKLPDTSHHRDTRRTVFFLSGFYKGNVEVSDRKQYIVPMFPYPSGSLHMGHVRVYTISDCLSRFASLLGYDIIHPIGWDAFGLPAENAALERGLGPDAWTKSNIKSMKEQLLDLGCNFDWSREISTCDPSYYRWTQWIFIQLFKAGLVKHQRSLVNWDPVDQTVLANEQIDSNGRSWRSGAPAEQKILRQWFVRITRYAQKLWDGLEKFGHWDDIVQIQRNWIGPCDTYRFHLPLLDSITGKSINEELDVCLKTPRDLLTAQLVAVKSSHILCNLSARKEDSNFYLTISALNPLTKGLLPIVVSDGVHFDEHQEACLRTVLLQSLEYNPPKRQHMLNEPQYNLPGSYTITNYIRGQSVKR